MNGVGAAQYTTAKLMLSEIDMVSKKSMRKENLEMVLACLTQALE